MKTDNDRDSTRLKRVEQNVVQCDLQLVEFLVDSDAQGLENASCRLFSGLCHHSRGQGGFDGCDEIGRSPDRTSAASRDDLKSDFFGEGFLAVFFEQADEFPLFDRFEQLPCRLTF